MIDRDRKKIKEINEMFKKMIYVLLFFNLFIEEKKEISKINQWCIFFLHKTHFKFGIAT